MKVIEINNAYPGFENSLLKYAGTFTSSDNKYWINTKCKSILNVVVNNSVVVSGSIPEQTVLHNLYYTVNTGTDGYKYIEFIAKAGTVYYEITGSEKASLTNVEISDKSTSAFNWDKYHNHDGVNSRRLNASDISAGVQHAGKTVVVDSSGYLSYVATAITVPAIPIEVKIETVLTSTDRNSPQDLEIVSAGDMDIIWKPTGGAAGTGEVGVTYVASIYKWTENGSNPEGGTWTLQVTKASDSAGADAKIDNWDYNGTGEFVISVLYRMEIIATLTASGTTSTSGYRYFYFK